MRRASLGELAESAEQIEVGPGVLSALLRERDIHLREIKRLAELLSQATSKGLTP